MESPTFERAPNQRLGCHNAYKLDAEEDLVVKVIIH